jgi:hypothetical protein
MLLLLALHTSYNQPPSFSRLTHLSVLKERRYTGTGQEKEETNTSSIVPKSKIEILSQRIADEEGSYRAQAGTRVHHLIIPTNVFDDNTMCRPYLLIPKYSGVPNNDRVG